LKATIERTSSSACYLKNGEVFENTVHHVVLGQIAQFVYEADHVITESSAFNAVDVRRTIITTAARRLRLHTNTSLAD